MAFVAVADASSPFVADEGKIDVCSSMGVWLPLCVPSPNQTATAALGTSLGPEALAEDIPVAFVGGGVLGTVQKRLPQAAAAGLRGSGSGTTRKKHHDLNGTP